MDSQPNLEKTANLLLEISSMLMVSGANTNRANLSITRFASVLNYKAFSMVSHKTIVMTLTDEKTGESYTKVQNIPPYIINFSTISAISKASWNTIEQNWTIEQIEEEINKIKNKKRYSKIVVLTAVSFAGAGFCNIFGGDYTNMLIAFLSTFIGLFAVQQAHKRNFNVYIRILLGSFIASSLASLGVIYNIGENPQTALATSILFLVPGVALINSFTDLFDNNVLNGVVRFTTGLITVLAIALGLFTAMVIFQLN
ncbi:MAG: threonine/serine exporter family protein [Bacteroidota bacterium]